MKRQELQKKLESEVAKWSSKSYAELCRQEYPVAYDSGHPSQSPAFYQTEVVFLEKTDEYIHVTVSVSDAGWRAWSPLVDDIMVYAKESR